MGRGEKGGLVEFEHVPAVRPFYTHDAGVSGRGQSWYYPPEKGGAGEEY